MGWPEKRPENGVISLTNVARGLLNVGRFVTVL
jgi:hypothetical protein